MEGRGKRSEKSRFRQAITRQLIAWFAPNVINGFICETACDWSCHRFDANPVLNVFAALNAITSNNGERK
jgi:hypothetical protein